MTDDPIFSERPGEGLRQPSFKVSTRQLGVVILFVSLSVLFGASILAYVLTRLASDAWRAPGMPGLPRGLLASTGLLVGVSAAAQHALHCARRNQFSALNRALVLTSLFAVSFLIGQGMNWLHMLQALPSHSPSLYAFTFYLLTGVHAAHVLAGFVPLAWVMLRARRKEYTSSRHDGVKFCVQYWHFLGGVWLVLLTALFWGS
jgi:cytochrome c oxidase subunit III